MAVGKKHRVIVATTDQQTATDRGRLLPKLDVAAATVGRMPKKVLADARYSSKADLAEPELARNSWSGRRTPTPQAFSIGPGSLQGTSSS